MKTTCWLGLLVAIATLCGPPAQAQFVNDRPIGKFMGNKVNVAGLMNWGGGTNLYLGQAFTNQIWSVYGTDTPRTLYFAAGYYTNRGVVDFLSNYSLEFEDGAQIKSDDSGSQIITENDLIAPERAYIIHSSLLSFTNSANREVSACWFGLQPGAVAGNSAALTKAFAASLNVRVPSTKTAYVLADDVTTPANSILTISKGAKLAGSTATLTLGGRVLPADPHHHAFDLTLTVRSSINQEMSVGWFGATDNGNTDDDSPACVAANAASLNVYVPGYYYTYPATMQEVYYPYLATTVTNLTAFNLLSNSRLRGDGAGKSYIVVPVSKTWFGVNAVFIDGEESDMRTNITVEGLSLNGTNTVLTPRDDYVSGGRGLQIWGGNIKDIRIYNCDFKSNTHAGMAIFAQDRVTGTLMDAGPVYIRNCDASFNQENGFNPCVNNLVMSDCTADQNVFNGVEFDIGSASINNVRCTRNWVSGFTVYAGYNTKDVYNSGTGVTLVGCSAEFNRGNGFNFNNGLVGLAVSGCSAWDNGQGGSGYAGFYLTDAPNMRMGPALLANCIAIDNNTLGFNVSGLWASNRTDVVIRDCVAGLGRTANTTVAYNIDGRVALLNNRTVGTMSGGNYVFGANAVNIDVKSEEYANYSLDAAASFSYDSRAYRFLPGWSSAGDDPAMFATAPGNRAVVNFTNLAAVVVGGNGANDRFAVPIDANSKFAVNSSGGGISYQATSGEVVGLGVIGPSDTYARFVAGMTNGHPLIGFGPGTTDRDIFIKRGTSGEIVFLAGTPTPIQTAVLSATGAFTTTSTIQTPQVTIQSAGVSDRLYVPISSGVYTSIDQYGTFRVYKDMAVAGVQSGFTMLSATDTYGRIALEVDTGVPELAMGPGTTARDTFIKRDGATGDLTILFGTSPVEKARVTTTGGLTIQGTLNASQAPAKFKIYSQGTEPDIANDTMAFWTDTDDAKYYLILDIGGTQKKVELTP